MIVNLTDYRPETIEFVLKESIKEQFPTTLFENGKPAEIIKAVNDNFVAIFPENEVALRYLDDYEKSEIRDEYCKLVENEQPLKTLQLEEAIEEAKRIKREAEEKLAAVNETIRSLAQQVKKGTAEFPLDHNTFRIALNGYYLYYSIVDNVCKLVKAEVIPEWDKKSLWAQEDKNRQAMKELFGLDFPASDRPSDEVADNAEGEGADNDDDERPDNEPDENDF